MESSEILLPSWEKMAMCKNHAEASCRFLGHHTHTAYHSLLTSHCSPFTAHLSLLTTHRSLLTTYCPRLTTHRAPITAYLSPLILHRSLLTTHRCCIWFGRGRGGDSFLVLERNRLSGGDTKIYKLDSAWFLHECSLKLVMHSGCLLFWWVDFRNKKTQTILTQEALKLWAR